MKIPCSNCNQRLDIPEELAGQAIECPACNASLAVPKSGSNLADTEIYIPSMKQQFQNTEADWDYYGGLSRGVFWMLSFCIPIVLSILSLLISDRLAWNVRPMGLMFGTNVSFDLITILYHLSYLIINGILVYFRLKNIGMKPFWSICVIVPIMDIIVYYRCSACQEGYVENNKLDRTGRIITVIYLSLILGPFLIMFAYRLF